MEELKLLINQENIEIAESDGNNSIPIVPDIYEDIR